MTNLMKHILSPRLAFAAALGTAIPAPTPRPPVLAKPSVVTTTPDLGAIARGFGLRGTNVTDLGQLPSLLRDYEAGDTADIWNVPISDQVVSPRMRRLNIKGHGVI